MSANSEQPPHEHVPGEPCTCDRDEEPIDWTEGERCQVCGHTYTDDYWLPDEWWSLITPKPNQPGAGLLCPSCALARLRATT